MRNGCDLSCADKKKKKNTKIVITRFSASSGDHRKVPKVSKVIISVSTGLY